MSKLDPENINVILATDCGSTTTKAILIEKIDGQYRQTYRGEAPTTVEEPAADVTVGVANAVTEVGELAGRKLIDDEDRIIRPATDGDLVTIKYRLSTPQGKLILKDDEYRFILGSDSVISGVDEAVTGMSLRGERVVDCPPHKHWGRPGYGDGAVPPDTNLIIEVELLRIE